MTAPLRFALVPVEPTLEMKRQTRSGDLSYQHMLKVSPGNDLLERIVRARDIAGSCQHGTREWLNAVDELYIVLNELGGSNG